MWSFKFKKPNLLKHIQRSAHTICHLNATWSYFHNTSCRTLMMFELDVLFHHFTGRKHTEDPVLHGMAAFAKCVRMENKHDKSFFSFFFFAHTSVLEWCRNSFPVDSEKPGVTVWVMLTKHFVFYLFIYLFFFLGEFVTQ